MRERRVASWIDGVVNGERWYCVNLDHHDLTVCTLGAACPLRRALTV
jgi:hypothetical protein